MSRQADICGARWLGTGRRITTSAGQSRRTACVGRREGAQCEQKAIKPGEAIPEEWGGGVNKWTWPIPRLAKNIPTKPELVGHYAPESPDFNLRVPDQIRAETLLKHLKGWIADREAAKETSPSDT